MTTLKPARRARVTPYDERQLRRTRRLLADALRQTELALEPDRSDADRFHRCAFAASYAVQATTLLDQTTRRIARRRSKEYPREA